MKKLFAVFAVVCVMFSTLVFSSCTNKSEDKIKGDITIATDAPTSAVTHGKTQNTGDADWSPNY